MFIFCKLISNEFKHHSHCCPQIQFSSPPIIPTPVLYFQGLTGKIYFSTSTTSYSSPCTSPLKLICACQGAFFFSFPDIELSSTIYTSEYIFFVSVKTFYVASKVEPIQKLKSRFSFDLIWFEVLSSGSSNVIKDLISVLPCSIFQRMSYIWAFILWLLKQHHALPHGSKVAALALCPQFPHHSSHSRILHLFWHPPHKSWNYFSLVLI